MVTYPNNQSFGRHNDPRYPRRRPGEPVGGITDIGRIVVNQPPPPDYSGNMPPHFDDLWPPAKVDPSMPAPSVIDTFRDMFVSPFTDRPAPVRPPAGGGGVSGGGEAPAEQAAPGELPPTFDENDPVLPNEAPLPYKLGIDDVELNPPEPDAPETPEQAMQRQMEFWQRMMPQRDMSVSPEQQEANAFAKRGLDRTALLARLAFAGGLTSAGGPGWDQIGRGFSAAGQVYDEGFERYHKALGDAAEQEMSRRETQYQDQMKQTELAYTSYANEAKAASEAAKEHARRRKELFDLEKELWKESKPGEMASPEEMEAWQRKELDIRRRAGLPINVAD